jgi:hypothetical protein
MVTVANVVASKNAPGLIEIKVLGKVIEVRVEIRPKVSLRMVVTLLGMVSDVSRVSKKASVPISVTLSGMVIDVSEVAPLNASFPIDDRVFGRFMDDKEVVPSNALVPISVTPLGTETAVNPDA